MNKRKMWVAPIVFMIMVVLIGGGWLAMREGNSYQPIDVDKPTWVLSAETNDVKPGTPRFHYRPEDGWIGDIHPMYHNGKWQLYYLETPKASRMSGTTQFNQRLITSENLLDWTQQSIIHEDNSKDWWAIANLIHNGRMYSVQNNTQTGNSYDLSISEDFQTWRSFDQNPIVPARSVSGEPRDPFLFKNPETGEFWLVMAAKDMDIKPYTYTGKLYYSTSKDMLQWSELKTLYNPGNIGVPEVPELFAMDNWYYLVASYGKGRVGTGHYRIAESPEGPYETPEIDVLDGSEFMAPNSAADSERRITFGWIPTYRGNMDNGQWEWGGDMAFPRELYAGKDGLLYTKLPDEFLVLRDKTVYSSRTDHMAEYAIGNWEGNDQGVLRSADHNYGEVWLPGDYPNFELTTTVTMTKGATNAGILFRLGHSNFEGYEISIDLQHQMMHLRNHHDRRISIVSRPIKIMENQPMELRVIVDGNIVEVFLDDRYSMAGRALVGSPVNKVGFYADNGGISIADTTIYEWSFPNHE